MTPGPYEARHAPGIPTDCCDFGIVSLSQGREVCRVWERDDAEHLAAILNRGWQPIETAPKSRMLLVGFFNSAGKWRSMHAQYRDDLPQHDDADADDEPAEAGWYEGSLEAEMLFPVRPTHWQFLPAPPATNSAAD